MKKCSKYTYIAAGILLIICGIMHVQGIFYGEDLDPQNPNLIALMKATSIKMDPEGIVWDLWIGFHAMYGACLVFMGLVLAFLSIRNFTLHSTPHFIPLVFLGTVGFFLWIGIKFLITPFVLSMAIIMILLLIGYLTALLQRHFDQSRPGAL